MIRTGAIAAIEVSFGDGATAQIVTVREGNSIVAVDSIEDATAAASGRAGFRIVAPREQPEGCRLTEISIPAAPNRGAPVNSRRAERVASARMRRVITEVKCKASGTPNSLNLAVLSYGPKDNAGPGDAVVRIEQTGFRYSAPEDRARRIDLGKAGADVYFQATERAVAYWVFTEDRGILIAGSGSKLPPESEMRKMVASLVP